MPKGIATGSKVDRQNANGTNPQNSVRILALERLKKEEDFPNKNIFKECQ